MNSDETTPWRPLAGKTALVTGGTRGIGAAICAKLSQAGAFVYATGRERGKDVRASLLFVDFADDDSTDAFLGRIADLSIDILVNNAGINKIAPFSEIEAEDFDLIQKVNMRAGFLCSQAVLPYMKSQNWGRVLSLSSIFGVVSRTHRAAYSTSKFALQGWSRALAVEVAKSGILVNCLAPGFIETDLTREVIGAEGMSKLATEVPMGRLGQPSEIAEAVLWLVSPANTYLTGQNIVIDGGFTSV